MLHFLLQLQRYSVWISFEKWPFWIEEYSSRQPVPTSRRNIRFSESESVDVNNSQYLYLNCWCKKATTSTSFLYQGAGQRRKFYWEVVNIFSTFKATMTIPCLWLILDTSIPFWTSTWYFSGLTKFPDFTPDFSSIMFHFSSIFFNVLFFNRKLYPF